MVANSLVHMGIDQLHGGGGAIYFAGTENFFWVLAYSFAMPLYMDGFLNQFAGYISYWFQILSLNLSKEIFFFHLLLIFHSE